MNSNRGQWEFQYTGEVLLDAATLKRDLFKKADAGKSEVLAQIYRERVAEFDAWIKMFTSNPNKVFSLTFNDWQFFFGGTQ